MRGAQGRPRPTVTVQLEAEPSLYLRLTSRELGKYAGALARCWSLLGLGRGDIVAIFDYGTSPVTYLASSAFFPHLRRGASDLLGCLPICSDGLPQMAPRVVSIIRYVRPRALFMRPDGLLPLADHAEREGLVLSKYVRSIVVSQDEGLLGAKAKAEWQARLGVPVYSLLRIDRSLFLAVECARCRAFHTWPDLYRVLSLEPGSLRALPAGEEGLLRVAPTFARSLIGEYVSSLTGALLEGGCDHGPEDQRIAL